MKQSMRFLACSKTDTGLQRQRNEDVGAANAECHFFMVADGMGGRAGGDLASGLFLQATCATFQGQEELTIEAGAAHVQTAFRQANQQILDYAIANPAFVGMGCTAEILCACHHNFVLGHVGDSRTYLFRNNRLEQLTRDHSLVQSQVEQGVLSRNQAENSQFRNILLRAVGIDPKLDVDISSGELLPGDIFLLCTDGLHGMVKDDEIIPVLAFPAPLFLKTEMLINMANDAGGRDNVTVTLVEVLQPA